MVSETGDGARLSELSLESRAIELWRSRFPTGDIQQLGWPLANGSTPALWIGPEPAARHPVPGMLVVRGILSTGALSCVDSDGRAHEIPESLARKGKLYEAALKRELVSRADFYEAMRELGFYQQAAIAATLLERMLPNYQLFAEVTQSGDAALPRHILTLVWEWLTVKKAKINFDKLSEELELITPQVSDFDIFGVYPAVDCATALDMMLSGIAQQDAGEFVNVAKISQATVARLIEHDSIDDDITTEAELKKIVREHPLMQYEMDCLAELIALVSPIKQFGRDERQLLQSWVAEQGLTNLGMELSSSEAQ